MNNDLHDELIQDGTCHDGGPHNATYMLCDARCTEAMVWRHAADALRNDLDTNVREALQFSNFSGGYETGRLVPCKLTGSRL